MTRYFYRFETDNNNQPPSLISVIWKGLLLIRRKLAFKGKIFVKKSTIASNLSHHFSYRGKTVEDKSGSLGGNCLLALSEFSSYSTQGLRRNLEIGSDILLWNLLNDRWVTSQKFQVFRFRIAIIQKIIIFYFLKQ